MNQITSAKTIRSTELSGTGDKVQRSHMNYLQNIPIDSTSNGRVEILGQCQYKLKRRYTKAQQIDELAVSKYNKNGKGITFNDLLSSALYFIKNKLKIY